MKKILYFFFSLLWGYGLFAQNVQEKKIPVVGFLDAFEDETIAQANKGFYDALAKNGFSEKEKTLKVIYRNAQGDIPTLTQAMDYFISQKVDLIAANPTLSTITAVQKTKSIPVCTMVSSEPKLIGLIDKKGQPFPNLLGAYDDLEYIGTSVRLIRSLLPKVKRLGVIYNQSEPQSINAFQTILKEARKAGFEVLAQPVNNSSETQLVMESLISRKMDVFFAMPDNVVFSSFEVIYKTCTASGIPVFTSEEGLVKRGSVAAYGADMYQWGYQSGMLAAEYLKNGKILLEKIKVHKRVYNQDIARKFGITPPKDFEAVKSLVSEMKSADYSNFYLAAVMLGLAFVALGWGIFISMRIFDIPDITTDGSYTLGAAVTGTLLLLQVPVWLIFPAVLLSGAMAGICTGIIHTRLKVNALLAGILMMTALYSVNLQVMGKSNLPLIQTDNLLHLFVFKGSSTFFSELLVLAVITLLLFLWITYLLKTDFGLAMRATGNSEQMIRANGVNTDLMKITGLGISNALVAFSGFLVTQYQGFADINMGIGIVITGLGSVMIGETLTQWMGLNKIQYRIAGVIAGTILFRLILALALTLGVDPNWLKLVTAIFVLGVVALPNLKKLN